MTSRLKGLERIAAVQKQMVRLSEWRLAAAERICRELTEDQARLQGYVVEEGALGVPLARSALRSLHRLDDRLEAAEQAREANRVALTASKRRENAIDQRTEIVRRAEQRKTDDRELAMTLEAWLAARGPGADTSLP